MMVVHTTIGCGLVVLGVRMWIVVVVVVVVDLGGSGVVLVELSGSC